MDLSLFDNEDSNTEGDDGIPFIFDPLNIKHTLSVGGGLQGVDEEGAARNTQLERLSMQQ